MLPRLRPLLLLIPLLCILWGCTDPLDGISKTGDSVGSLTIKVAAIDRIAATIVPVDYDQTALLYSITATLDATTLSLSDIPYASLSSTATFSALAFGDWTVTVTASTNGGVAVYSQTQTVTISKASTVADFVLSGIQTESGTGNMSVTLTVPVDTFGELVASDVYVSLVGSGENYETVEVTSVTVGSTITYTLTGTGYASGNYDVDCSLSDESGEALLAPVYLLLKIYDNQTSVGTITLDSSNINTVPQDATNFTAAWASPSSTDVLLTWTDVSFLNESYVLYRDGEELATLSGVATSYTDTESGGTEHEYTLCAENRSGMSDGVTCSWTNLSFTLTYSNDFAESGTVPVDSTPYSSGSTATMKYNTGKLTRSGYRFAGWATTSDSPESFFKPGVGTLSITENTILYPVWWPVTIKSAGMGTNTSDSDTYFFSLDSDGYLYLWGDNTFGQLGLGNTTDTTSPEQSAMDVSAAFVGYGNSFYIDSSGNLWGCGTNLNYELGIGNADNQTEWVQIIDAGNAGYSVVQVFAGVGYTEFLTDGGDVYAMGSANYSAMGNAGALYVPKKIGSLSNIASILGGREDAKTMFINTAGQVYGTGNNDNGEFGIGNTTSYDSPTLLAQVLADTSSFAGAVDSISCGWTHALYLSTDHTLYAAGGSGEFYLGPADTNNAGSTRLLEVSTDVIAMAAGQYTTLFVKADGNLYGCGRLSFVSSSYNDTSDLTVFYSPGDITSVSYRDTVAKFLVIRSDSSGDTLWYYENGTPTQVTFPGDS